MSSKDVRATLVAPRKRIHRPAILRRWRNVYHFDTICRELNRSQAEVGRVLMDAGVSLFSIEMKGKR